MCARIVAVALSVTLAGSCGAARADSESLCLRDEELSKAAARLLLAARRPDAEALRRAVRDAGSDAVDVKALWLPEPGPLGVRKAQQPERRVRHWLRDFHKRADAPVVCGEARGTAGRLVIATARGGWLAPIDGTSTLVRGGLALTFSDPQLVVLDGRGELHHYRIDTSSLQRGIPIAARWPLPAHLQLVARGSAGPRPVAERLIAPETGPEGKRSSAEREQPSVACPSCSLQARLNRLRERSQALPVRSNRLLSEVAATHARATCRDGRVVHELTAGQDPETRLARSGVRARVVGEAVARSVNATAAFVALTRSPSHLLTLVDPRFTDAGMAVAHDPSGDACLVVLLAAWPRVLGAFGADEVTANE